MSASRPEDIPGLVATAFNAGDPNALMALYEPKAVMVVPPGGARVKGLAAIRETVEPMFARITRATIDLVGTVRAEELAMTHADWTLTGTDEAGAAVAMSGRGTVVSRRQADGNWLVVFDNPLSA